MRTCFLLGWVNVTMISGVLSSLVVMMLTWLVRGWGSTPVEAQNFFRSLMVTYLTHCYIKIR